MTRRFVLLAIASLAACTADPPEPPPSIMLVADRTANRIVAFDGVSGAFEREIANVDRPSSARLGPDGAVYIASFGDSEITRVDFATGAPLGSFFRDTGLLEEPVELLFRGSEVVVLGNDTNNAVVVDATGTMIHDVGYPDMRGAHDFVFGSDNLLYVATEHDVATGSTMQLWDVDSGALLRRFGPLEQVANASGVERVGDALYVTDYERGTLLMFDASYDQVTVLATDLVRPVSVELGLDGLLYVIDDTGIQRRHLDGAYISTIVARGANLAGPRSLSFIPR